MRVHIVGRGGGRQHLMILQMLVAVVFTLHTRSNTAHCELTKELDIRQWHSNESMMMRHASILIYYHFEGRCNLHCNGVWRCARGSWRRSVGSEDNTVWRETGGRAWFKHGVARITMSSRTTTFNHSDAFLTNQFINHFKC